MITAARLLRQLAIVGGALAYTGEALPAHASSMTHIEQQLDAREKYFQALDRPAPTFQLQDAEGHPMSLADLADKVAVVNFVYTHCPDVCPLHAEKIAAVQKLVNQTALRDRVRFLTITTDPARDTPSVLRAFGPQHGLDPANWVFLTSGAGNPDATRKLAQEFGHRFDETPDGLQMHGVVTHVIDQEGRLRGNFYGLDFKDANLALFIDALADGNRLPEAGGAPAHVSWMARLRDAVMGR